MTRTAFSEFGVGRTVAGFQPLGLCLAVILNTRPLQKVSLVADTRFGLVMDLTDSELQQNAMDERRGDQRRWTTIRACLGRAMAITLTATPRHQFTQTSCGGAIAAKPFLPRK
ncbi:MAG TPA: hypothetical protein DDZ51_05730 [Planctomycetaceae bacterium]|nr:hypothetical protein [Planctomycetaceae bacterium]